MTLATRFGNVLINKNGYYAVCSEKEGNFNKLLHRLIYEEHYGIKIPNNCCIHHINGDKLDNRISNLQMMTRREHSKLHNTGENNPFFDKNIPFDSKLDLSKNRNTTGFFRVSKKRNSSYKKGYVWQYRYYYKGEIKIIYGNTLEKLYRNVVANGLEWIILDKDTAKSTLLMDKKEGLK